MTVREESRGSQTFTHEVATINNNWSGEINEFENIRWSGYLLRAKLHIEFLYSNASVWHEFKFNDEVLESWVNTYSLVPFSKEYEITHLLRNGANTYRQHWWWTLLPLFYHYLRIWIEYEVQNTTVYICQDCGKEYSTREEALACQASHRPKPLEWWQYAIIGGVIVIGIAGTASLIKALR